MKIGNPADKPTPSIAATGTAAVNGNVQSGAGATPTDADPSAKIELSNAASTLLTADGSDEFDTAKVSRLSKSIEDGSYKINHGAIADKLISNAQELLSKVQP